ncbi:MAG: hypothetical protein JRN52_08845 [Nitrososphaerota archaeon]|nr:hypothetical protein [Nitrososphaerota archaeon]
MSEDNAIAKREVALIKEATNLISSRPKTPSLEKTNESLIGITKERGNSGSKLMKVGTAMIIMPDPVTGAIGVPVLVAGKMISNRRASNLKNVYEEVNSTLTSLASAVSSL